MPGPTGHPQGPSLQAPVTRAWDLGLAPWRPTGQETPFLAQQLGARARHGWSPRRPLTGDPKLPEGWERNEAEDVYAMAAPPEGLC